MIDANHPEVLDQMTRNGRTLEEAIAFVEQVVADMKAAAERYRTGNLSDADRANNRRLASHWHQRNWSNSP